ncbi:hypothetical protein LAZ67_8001911 [Cordylochernes scorpioides]|uniref:Uncharacterized protein n=1 Tax=Cordylochernes scorpioides TaxID=51811 RepID=A0ABY6KR60_9ARAC|nr:hypothetical protein LAZ67_8001911 [Cordylochernes scorpioides]
MTPKRALSIVEAIETKQRRIEQQRQRRLNWSNHNASSKLKHKARFTTGMKHRWSSYTPGSTEPNNSLQVWGSTEPNNSLQVRGIVPTHIQLHELIKENPRIGLQDIEEETGISKSLVGSIIKEDLQLKKTPSKFVPKMLTIQQK